MPYKESDMPEENSLDIAEVLQIMWNHKAVIILLVLIASLMMFTRTVFFTEDTYTCYGVLHISNKTEKNNADETAIQKNDIETAKSQSTTYMEILKTRIFLKEISGDTGGKYTWQQIHRALSMTPVNETELLKISVTTTNYEDSYQIVQSIMQKAPKKLISVYKSGEVEEVDPPLYSEIPDDKGVAKNTAIGFAVGLVLGVMYAFLFTFFDKKVHKGEELAKRYNISVLGETAQFRKNNKAASENNDETKKILSDDSDFDTVETYKSIRTNIMFSIPKREKGRVIVITSASQGEGKTTTTINLAITFAQIGARVALVDCDLRRSRIHRYLQIERSDGVSNVVCGYTDIKDAVKTNVRGNLDCLTAGEIPPNPAELLETEEFQNMVSELQQVYDYIFIDTPPITLVTDAAVVMKLCSGVVVVAQQGITRYDLLDSAIDEIKKTGVNILGAILHDSNEKHKKYGYYRKNKYRYGYKNEYRYGDEN